MQGPRRPSRGTDTPGPWSRVFLRRRDQTYAMMFPWNFPTQGIKPIDDAAAKKLQVVLPILVVERFYVKRQSLEQSLVSQ